MRMKNMMIMMMMRVMTRTLAFSLSLCRIEDTAQFDLGELLSCFVFGLDMIFSCSSCMYACLDYFFINFLLAN